jgi:hypothetical protein
MIIKQSGARVVVFRGLALIVGLFLLLIIVSLPVNLWMSVSTGFQNEAYWVSAILSFVFSITLLLPCWFLIWIFPDIRFVDKGIELRVFGFKAIVNWGDVAGLRIGGEGGLSAIYLKKTPRIMFWNRLYGMYVGEIHQPVVLLSMKKDRLDLVAQAIGENAHVPIHQRERQARR